MRRTGPRGRVVAALLMIAGVERFGTFSAALAARFLVAAAMTTYEMAKGLARDPDSAGLAAHLESLRRDLGSTTEPRVTPATPAPD